MTTTVTLTGTGVPIPSPGRAGPGTLVQYGDLSLQFDAGRATTLRLAEAGVQPHALTALFLTHVHSDHVVDLPDLVMARWIERNLHLSPPLPVVAVDGLAARFVERMLDPYQDDLAIRTAHEISAQHPEVRLQTFGLPEGEPEIVWQAADDSVTVQAVAVRHQPVPEAVGFRVDTPDGAVVISGDTRVCDPIEHLCAGAQILVHEACRATALADAIRGTPLTRIFDYHADTVALGAMAERAGVPHVVLTHLIPAPAGPDDEAAYVTDLRDGGYTGTVSVGVDHLALTF